MPKAEGQQIAIDRAIEELREIDLVERCKLLGLPAPRLNRLVFDVFGDEVTLDLASLQAKNSNGEAVRPGDHILILHYLQCDLPISPSNELISYRDFPGGQFYYGPFQDRTVKPLVKRFDQNIEALRCNLNRFDWIPIALGDLGARIHALGQLSITLVYRDGDDEFAPSADILFDSSLKRVYDAEDAAVMASRICIGLL